MKRQTGFMPVVTGKSTTVPSFNPLSSPVGTVVAARIRLTLQVVGSVDCKVCPAIQFSNDRVNWGASESLKWRLSGGIPAAVYVDGSSEWERGDRWIELPADVAATQQRFARFGVRALSTDTKSLKADNATVNLHVEFAPLKTRVVAPAPRLVSSFGNTEKFTALTGTMPAGDFRSVRASWEMMSESGDLRIQGAMQTSADGETWSSPTRIRSSASWATALGWDYGADFEDRILAEYVRFGLLADSGTSSTEMGYGRIIVEGRGG